MSIGDSLRCGGAVVALLMLASCAGLEQRALEPTDRTAVVKATTWGRVYRGGYVEIASVNGVEPSWRLRSEMELAAGPQTAMFYVYLCNGGMRDCISITQAQISFRAEPRHTYRVRAREQLNGSNRFWVWVEDEADGKTVGGTQPPAPAAAGLTGLAQTCTPRHWTPAYVICTAQSHEKHEPQMGILVWSQAPRSMTIPLHSNSGHRA
jgi:hypothetical protein